MDDFSSTFDLQIITNLMSVSHDVWALYARIFRFAANIGMRNGPKCELLNIVFMSF